MSLVYYDTRGWGEGVPRLGFLYKSPLLYLEVPMIHLTEKQEKFCYSYIEHRNAGRAAREAGYAYPDIEGWKLLQNPKIVETIEELSAARNKRLGISKDWVLSELMDQLAVLKAEEKPKLNSKTGKAIKDEEGNAVYVRNEAGITKVLELIGKLAGVDAFNNKVDVTVTRDEELIAAIRQGAKQASGDKE